MFNPVTRALVMIFALSAIFSTIWIKAPCLCRCWELNDHQSVTTFINEDVKQELFHIDSSLRVKHRTVKPRPNGTQTFSLAVTLAQRALSCR